MYSDLLIVMSRIYTKLVCFQISVDEIEKDLRGKTTESHVYYNKGL